MREAFFSRRVISISVATAIIVAVTVWGISCFLNRWRPLDLAGMPESLPQTLPSGVVNPPGWVNADRDEPFDVQAYFESCRPPADNAAPLYFAAMADMNPYMDFVYPQDQWESRVSEVKAFQEEICQALGMDMPLYEALSKGLVSEADIDHILADAQPTLKKIAFAQQRPRCVFISSLDPSPRGEHLFAARVFTCLCQYRAYHASKLGDKEESKKVLAQMLRLSRDLRPRGWIWCQFIARLVENEALRGLALFTLPQKGLTFKDCDRLAALLIEHRREAIPPMQEGLRMEYIILRSMIHDLQTGRHAGEEYLKNASIDPGQLANANWTNEILVLKSAYRASAKMLNQPYYRVSPRAFEKQYLPKAKNLGPIVCKKLFQRRHMVMEQAEGIADVNGSLCLVAVWRYKLAHGKLPQRLDDALKEVSVDSVPVDPYDGNPMRYKVLDGNPIVYSIGPDRRNHGGRKEKRWYCDRQPGDFVFKIGEQLK